MYIYTHHTYIHLYICIYTHTHNINRVYTMYMNVLTIYTEYILANMNSGFRTKMRVLVEIKNSHKQIVLGKFKIIVLALFVQ